MRNLAIACFCLLLVTPSVAQEYIGFSAICTTDESRRYDSAYAYDGSRLEPEWSENENFYTPDWAFSYKGGDTIEIAGKEYTALLFGPELIFAVEPSVGSVGVSLWTYAINLKMKEIVATQVNSSIGAAPLIKARIVTFDCKWSFH
jgi:hypothetical protein